MNKQLMLGCALLMAAVPMAAAQLTLVGVENGASTVAFQGPGDIVGTNWKFWGGMRAFSAATRGTNAIEACDPSATTTCTNVATDATTGELPTTITIAGTSHNCVADDCTIRTLYDQSGAGNNATQATAANRPLLKHNCTTHNKWCMNWPNGGASAQLITATLASTDPNTFWFGVNPQVATTAEMGTETVNGFQCRHDSAANSLLLFNGVTLGPTVVGGLDGAWNTVVCLYGAAVLPGIAIYANGSSITTNSSATGAGTMGLFNVGGGFGLPCSCFMTEAGLNNAVLSGTQISNLNTNTQSWF